MKEFYHVEPGTTKCCKTTGIDCSIFCWSESERDFSLGVYRGNHMMGHVAGEHAEAVFTFMGKRTGWYTILQNKTVHWCSHDWILLTAIDTQKYCHIIQCGMITSFTPMIKTATSTIMPSHSNYLNLWFYSSVSWTNGVGGEGKGSCLFTVQSKSWRYGVWTGYKIDFRRHRDFEDNA